MCSLAAGRPLPRDEHRGDPLQYVRAGRGQRRLALAVLLTGHADSHAAGVDGFLKHVTEHHLSLDDLWMATDAGHPLACMLVVPSPGRTAMAFISPVASDEHRPIVAGLARHVCAAQSPARLRLIQVLLDEQQQREKAALQDAGFNCLAQLLYMQRTISRPQGPGGLDLDPPISAVRYSKANRHHFEAAILESYHNTLDCPGLVGLRKIDDIIAGHMAAGRFKPELWLALHHRGEPVGVMLLNLVPQHQGVELVYLGISPAWRGRGLAGKLLTHAFAAAADHGATNIILAVDAANKPALHLYRTMNFRTTGRRLAMMYVVDAG